MILNIKGNGLKGGNVAKGNRFGPIEVVILGNGKIVWLMVLEHYTTLMEMYMKVNGKKIKQMGKEHLFIQMERNILGNGKIIINTVWEFNNGSTERSTKDNTFKDPNKEKDY